MSTISEMIQTYRMRCVEVLDFTNFERFFRFDQSDRENRGYDVIFLYAEFCQMKNVLYLEIFVLIKYVKCKNNVKCVIDSNQWIRRPICEKI